MRAAKAIALYAVAVLILGALLAPWLFWLVHHLPAAESLARQPFRRIFNRALLIVALAGLWPLLRALKFRSWADLGYAGHAAWWRHALWGLGVGLVSGLAGLCVLKLAGSQPVDWQRPAGEFAATLGKFTLTGLLVALIEETLFRGGIQGALQREIKPLAALVIASCVYSALHFLKPKGVNLAPADVNWLSGFECLGAILRRSYTPAMVVPFVSLLLVGGALGLAYQHSRALYLPVGLHAGWVVANETGRWLGVGRLVESIWLWPVTVVVMVSICWLCKRKLQPLR